MTLLIQGYMEGRTVRHNRKYVIIEEKDVNKIDFSKVMQTSPFSMRCSIDGTKTFVKYEGDQPEFIYGITKDAIGLPEYSHSEILEILSGPQWTNQD